jgi:hypothetical protein
MGEDLRDRGGSSKSGKFLSDTVLEAFDILYKLPAYGDSSLISEDLFNTFHSCRANVDPAGLSQALVL